MKGRLNKIRPGSLTYTLDLLRLGRKGWKVPETFGQGYGGGLIRRQFSSHRGRSNHEESDGIGRSLLQSEGPQGPYEWYRVHLNLIYK